MTPDDPTPDNFMIQHEEEESPPNVGYTIREQRKAKRKVMEKEEYKLQREEDDDMKMW